MKNLTLGSTWFLWSSGTSIIQLTSSFVCEMEKELRFSLNPRGLCGGVAGPQGAGPKEAPGTFPAGLPGTLPAPLCRRDSVTLHICMSALLSQHYLHSPFLFLIISPSLRLWPAHHGCPWLSLNHNPLTSAPAATCLAVFVFLCLNSQIRKYGSPSSSFCALP